ncbi:MAG: efflux RND transporter periplasmic adaptor subunit, partial [bacterium]
SKQQYDNTKNQYELAKAQYEAALQVQSMTNEGSRAEDIRSAQEAVRQARAETVAARAGVKEAKAAALQTKVRKQQIAGAQAQIGQARANLQLASVTQSYAVIPAPFDGVIAQRMADPGAMASPGVPLLKIQGGVLRLEAIVPESVLAKVVLGQRVSVILDALPNSNIIGRVAEISPKGDSTSHTFIVKINLPAEAGVRAGMFGRARFRIGQEPGLLVPSTAVWEREGLNYIFVISTGKAQLRLVTIGESSGSFIPILSGLTSEERVVISNRERLTDGSSVTDDRR